MYIIISEISKFNNKKKSELCISSKEKKKKRVFGLTTF